MSDYVIGRCPLLVPGTDQRCAREKHSVADGGDGEPCSLTRTWADYRRTRQISQSEFDQMKSFWDERLRQAIGFR